MREAFGKVEVGRYAVELDRGPASAPARIDRRATRVLFLLGVVACAGTIPPFGHVPGQFRDADVGAEPEHQAGGRYRGSGLDARAFDDRSISNGRIDNRGRMRVLALVTRRLRLTED